MKTYFCWRCEMDMPMLEESEWEVIEPLLTKQIAILKNYREQTGCDLKTAMKEAFKPATDKYFELTGFLEANHNAIWHHRLKAFGPECVSCGHLLRTPKASYCANCGTIKQ
jgi:hypothetical protein